MKKELSLMGNILYYIGAVNAKKQKIKLLSPTGFIFLITLFIAIPALSLFMERTAYRMYRDIIEDQITIW